jgi:hypothetical protein
MSSSKNRKSDAEAPANAGSAYEVGYGRPPLHSRFQKGQSGNPKGKPKGAANYRTDARKFIGTQVKVTIGGKKTIVSKQMAAMMVLWDQVMKRDARALARFLDLAREVNNEDIANIATTMQSEEDAKIMENLKARLLARRKKDGGES